MYHLFYNSVVHLIYSRVPGQCAHVMPLNNY